MPIIHQISSAKQTIAARSWRVRILGRRIRIGLADSPVLRLLAALGILTSGYLTLWIVMGAW